MAGYDLIIIGGGAAGLIAGGRAAELGRRVLLLEKMEKPARKVRITGKGRCNLTNIRPREEFLAKVKQGAEFFSHSFSLFDNEGTLGFFRSLGVDLTTERGGRVFPTSGRAWDIADALARYAQIAGCEIACYARATDIISGENGVTAVEYMVADSRGREQKRRAECRDVLIATGGVSYPATGSTGDGYTLAHRLGHTIVPVRPSLTPLEVDIPNLRGLEGLILKNISATLIVGGSEAATENGEMEFTSVGLGGAIVLRLSRRAVDALIDGEEVALKIDLKPGLDVATLSRRILREAEAAGGRVGYRALLRKLMPQQLINTFAALNNINQYGELTSADKPRAEALARALKTMNMRVVDYRPFEEAVVTAGGVSLEEVDPMTMGSTLVRGLYFAGEVLDIDADTGGYNLQVAFSTGRLAGELKQRSKA